MSPTITAFESSPDRGEGQARDMRVRWALEEVGEPYEVRLVSFREMKEPAHRALHASARSCVMSTFMVHVGEKSASLAPKMGSLSGQN